MADRVVSDPIPLEVRSALLLRARGACEHCGAALDTWSGYSVHHRKLRSQGGSNDPSNLVVLAGSGSTICHALVHSRRKEIGEPGGWIVPSWADPAEVPILLHGRTRTYLTDHYTYEAVAA